MSKAWDYRSLEEDLLARAVDDWVNPSELLTVVRRSGITDPNVLRDLAIGLLARMLVENLVVVGDIGQTHIPWEGTPGEVICRIIRWWGELDNPFDVISGGMFWIDLTSAGEAIGKAVLEREDGQQIGSV